MKYFFCYCFLFILEAHASRLLTKGEPRNGSDAAMARTLARAIMPPPPEIVTRKAETSQMTNISAAPANVIKFGPSNCVSLWRDNKTGHCMMQTDCREQDTLNHTFGLTCKKLDWPGSSLTRHEFGKDSFASQETFDTLIPCYECLPLESAQVDPDLDETLPQLVSDWRWRTVERGLVKDIVGAMRSFKDLAGDHLTIHQKSMQLRHENEMKMQLRGTPSKSETEKSSRDLPEDNTVQIKSSYPAQAVAISMLH